METEWATVPGKRRSPEETHMRDAGVDRSHMKQLNRVAQPKHIDRVRQMIRFAALLWAPAAAAQGGGRGGAPPPPYVEATGSAEVHLTPDRAGITIAVETRAQTAAEVGAANARIQRRVLDTLQLLGFRAPNVSTAGYTVTPQYDNAAQGQRERGYLARNTIQVRLSDLARIGTVIDAALGAGATRIEGIAYQTTKADSARPVALAQAAEHAHAEASALTQALGVKLGPVISITAEGMGGTPYASLQSMRSVSMAPAVATEISPGDIVVRASVAGRWQVVGNP
jgi:uncharacterized protein YggE